MQAIQQKFQVSYQYTVHFTNGLFNLTNPLFGEVFKKGGNIFTPKVLLVVDNGVADAHPQLVEQIISYSNHYTSAFNLCTNPIIMLGGEACKNDPLLVDQMERAVHEFGIDRHSYIVAIGGGAFLDMVGYAAAISHRGVRHIRIPTTVLAQNDSGVGVKNSINAFNKKNFLGTFAPPVAVINDFDFLLTLHDRDWRSGISEAIKVALIKDASFFDFLQKNANALANREMEPMKKLIFLCAKMHMEHISGGDPFEMGSSRPLDFGHWAAHKLEQLTNYEVRHGEAVAIGIALDSSYSYLAGMLTKAELDQILLVMEEIGFDLYHPALATVDNATGQLTVVKGLTEFREHLGGQLTIMLLEKIGKGVEVHQMDAELVKKAIKHLEDFSLKINA